MPEPDLRNPVSGTCVFGAGRLVPHIDALSREISGVRDGEDIEHIHRMRVASRRLRAALPLFSTCFSEKDFRYWMREVKKITRALGAARDADVQIAFLKKYLKTQNDATIPANPLAQLLARLQKRRRVLQDQVVTALDEMEESRILMLLQEACVFPEQPRISRRELYSGILPVAADQIGDRIGKIFRYEPFVHNPDAVFEHHALRIAAKKLRYTMETYAPLYRRDLKKPIGRIKKLQDLLGDIHDCDVWIEQMSLAIVRQRSRRLPKGDPLDTSVSAIAPLRRLLVNREKRRANLYRQFVRYWDSLSRTGFWDELHTGILTGQRSMYCIRRVSPAKMERAAFEHLAESVPDHAEHGATVSTLAAKLFDSLEKIHSLGRRDRTLLIYAALVHDIGGGDAHQKRSAGQILSAQGLPVKVREQGIIALVAGLHTGNISARPAGFFGILTNEDKKRVRMLAAILRIADGLDYLHAGTVTGLKCTLKGNDVICILSSTADASTEKSRAIRKSDLFTEVFGKTVVIP